MNDKRKKLNQKLIRARNENRDLNGSDNILDNSSRVNFIFLAAFFIVIMVGCSKSKNSKSENDGHELRVDERVMGNKLKHSENEDYLIQGKVESVYILNKEDRLSLMLKWGIEIKLDHNKWGQEKIMVHIESPARLFAIPPQEAVGKRYYFSFHDDLRNPYTKGISVIRRINK